jgi:membrane-bound lytic murein transglycosylase D
MLQLMPSTAPRTRLMVFLVGSALLWLAAACSTISSHPNSKTPSPSPQAALPSVQSKKSAAPSMSIASPAPSTGTMSPTTDAIMPPLIDPRSVGTIIDEPTYEPDEAPEEAAPPAEAEITYDVPIVINASVEGHLEYFQTTIKERFAMWLQRSKQYLPVMKEIFKQHGLPEDLVFVALIESGFNPYAYSRSRAVGPWQFINGTGRRYGLKINEWIDERRDPVKSTDAAARYLKDLYEMFGSWPLALASYNAGEGKVARAIARTRSDDFWEIKQTRNLRPETRNYVPKFMAATIIAKNPEKYGFALEDAKPFAYDAVPIDSPTDLRVIAKAAGVTYDEIKMLNPELRQGITPLYYPDYQIKLPSGTRDTFIENFSQLPKEERLIWIRHTVRQGETLASLARRYGTTTSTLQEANQLGRRTTIRVGTSLIIPTKGATAALSVPQAEPESTPDAPPASKRKEVYRVQSGDTLWDLSQRYHVTVKQIQRWNQLPSSTIRKGQRLTLFLPGQLS